MSYDSEFRVLFIARIETIVTATQKNDLIISAPMVRLSNARHPQCERQMQKKRGLWKPLRTVRHRRPSACAAAGPPGCNVDKAGKKIEPEHKGDRVAETGARFQTAKQCSTTSPSRHDTERDCGDCHPPHRTIFIHGDAYSPKIPFTFASNASSDSCFVIGRTSPPRRPPGCGWGNRHPRSHGGPPPRPPRGPAPR